MVVTNGGVLMLWGERLPDGLQWELRGLLGRFVVAVACCSWNL